MMTREQGYVMQPRHCGERGVDSTHECVQYARKRPSVLGAADQQARVQFRQCVSFQLDCHILFRVQREELNEIFSIFEVIS